MTGSKYAVSSMKISQPPRKSTRGRGSSDQNGAVFNMPGTIDSVPARRGRRRSALGMENLPRLCRDPASHVSRGC